MQDTSSSECLIADIRPAKTPSLYTTQCLLKFKIVVRLPLQLRSLE